MQHDPLAVRVRDTMQLATAGFRYLAQGQNPQHFTDRLRRLPSFLRDKHVRLLLDRTPHDVLTVAERQIYNLMLQGRGTGTERLPVCDTCETAFTPHFKSDDGIESTKTRCAGCIRTLSKEATAQAATRAVETQEVETLEENTP